MRMSLNSQLDMIDTTHRFSTSISSFKLKSDEANAIDNKSKKRTTSKKGVLESNSGRCSKQFETYLREDETMSSDSKVSELSSCSFSCIGSALNDPEAYILGIRSDMIVNGFENDSAKDYEHSANGDFVGSESNNCALSEEGGKSSAVVEVFSREATLNEYINEESDYSNLSTLVPPKSLENLYHSPESVMDSFDTKHSSFELFDSTESQLQLESLNLEPEETFSEASIIDLSHDSIKVKRWIRDGESRNFSYMVDVLHEAGFCDANSYIDFKKWHSLECPISPLVFNSLEKKYGKQASWPESGRQLLFDRINSQLVEIFNPVMNFHPGTISIRRRLWASFRFDEVVDKLRMKLIHQETEKSKAMEQWLELEEGVDIICRELETSLFDELAMELLVC